MAATRQEVLSLYRRVLRVARSWQALSGLPMDTETERLYIAQEARTLFRQNKMVTDPQLIKTHMEECKARIEIDAPSSNGTGHSEREKATRADKTEEAVQTHLPGITRRDLLKIFTILMA